MEIDLLDTMFELPALERRSAKSVISERGREGNARPQIYIYAEREHEKGQRPAPE